MRIIAISVGVHIIVLPILAHYGAFKKIGIGASKPVEFTMVALPKEKQQEVKKQIKAQPKVAPKSGGPRKSSEPKGAPLQQRVVAATAPAGSGEGGGATVVNPDKGAAPGTLVTPPTSKPPTTTPGAGNGGGGAPPTPTPAKPVPTPTPPTPTPLAQPKPHVPVVTEVATTYNPSPSIPDDLRGADLDTNVTAQFMVSPEGAPTDVKIVKSSGNDELDSIALDTARKWRFKPATRDGQAIESRVILHIEFEVQ
jgi:protein TonB